MELQRTIRKRSCRRKRRLERKDGCSEGGRTRVGVTEEDDGNRMRWGQLIHRSSAHLQLIL